MKPYWETVTFENAYAPIKVYALDSDEPGKISILTQNANESDIRCSCTSGFMHCHSYLEMLYILEDNTRIVINGFEFYADTGDLILINQYDIHEVQWPKRHWVLLIDPTRIFHMPHKEIHAIFPRSASHKHIRHIDYPTPSADRMRSTFEALIASLKSSSNHGSPETTGQFYLLLNAIRAYTALSEENPVDVIPLSHQKVIHEVLVYLDEHYHNPVTLDEIALRAGVTPNYFCRFFKRITGRSLMSYLNELRCQRARDLIEGTELPITTIAFDTGFASASYFNRKFREHWGTSPSKFRGRQGKT